METKTLVERKTPKLDRYAGKWVALGKEIVAVGDTLEELETRVKKLALKQQPVYFLVPRKDEGPYILTKMLEVTC